MLISGVVLSGLLSFIWSVLPLLQEVFTWYASAPAVFQCKVNHHRLTLSYVCSCGCNTHLPFITPSLRWYLIVILCQPESNWDSPGLNPQKEKLRTQKHWWHIRVYYPKLLRKYRKKEEPKVFSCITWNFVLKCKWLEVLAALPWLPGQT